MKSILIAFFSIYCLSACKISKNENDTPQALNDKSVDVSEYTKRVNYDLVDNLYNEIEENNPALKALFAEVQVLEKQKIDSTHHYLQFVRKNMAYYLAVTQKAAKMKDSVLRKEVLSLIDSSRRALNLQINGHQNLLKYLDSSKILLTDHFQLLKLVKTLEIMEDYQQKKLPDSTGFKMLLKKYAALVSKTDSLRENNP